MSYLLKEVWLDTCLHSVSRKSLHWTRRTVYYPNSLCYCCPVASVLIWTCMDYSTHLSGKADFCSHTVSLSLSLCLYPAHCRCKSCAHNPPTHTVPFPQSYDHRSRNVLWSYTDVYPHRQHYNTV